MDTLSTICGALVIICVLILLVSAVTHTTSFIKDVTGVGHIPVHIYDWDHGYSTKEPDDKYMPTPVQVYVDGIPVDKVLRCVTGVNGFAIVSTDEFDPTINGIGTIRVDGVVTVKEV